MPIADLTFSQTFNDFPVGAHPGRTELQLQHDETKGHINTVVKPAITALQGPPKARVGKTLNQSIPNGVNTAIQFDTELYDTDNIHDVAVNNTRLTCNTAGEYLISGAVRWASNGTGVRVSFISVNGTARIAQQDAAAPAGTYAFSQQLVTQYHLNAGDYVELLVYQDSGSALNVETYGSSASPVLSMARVGD